VDIKHRKTKKLSQRSEGKSRDNAHRGGKEVAPYVMCRAMTRLTIWRNMRRRGIISPNAGRAIEDVKSQITASTLHGRILGGRSYGTGWELIEEDTRNG